MRFCHPLLRPVLACFVVAFCTIAFASLHAAPGDLDTSFNGTGKAITPIGSSNDYGKSVAVQADGKIVVAGFSNNGSNYDFALVRYNADGTLDTSFNGTGKAVTPIGSNADEGYSVAVQADGKIVVAGESFNGSNYDFALVRYNADGTLDTTFNGTGKAITPIGFGDDRGESVAVQADGKIVVAGLSINGVDYDFAVARYNADGTLDTAFNGTGKAITPISSRVDAGYSVAVQADGKIVVAGYSSNGSNDDFAVARYNGVASIAGPITNSANGHQDYLLSESDWVTSENVAKNLSGHLVTINDAAENQWVFDTFSAFEGANRSLWLGFNAAATEGTFVWASGEPSPTPTGRRETRTTVRESRATRTWISPGLLAVSGTTPSARTPTPTWPRSAASWRSSLRQ